MRVAVASTDGVSVNEHFGKAGKFLIYELLPSGPRFVEERPCEAYSGNDPEQHTFDAEKFKRVAGLLRDCRRVYVTRIGQRPAEELALLDIRPVVGAGPIKQLLQAQKG